jgi:hypothetical protein
MRIIIVTVVAAALALATAADLVVYPFESQDPIVGLALADRVAASLGGDIVGPAATPALVVPLVASDGFVNPIVFLGQGGPFGRNGAWLLRGVLGSGAAVTGSIRAEGDALVLHLVVAEGERLREVRLRAGRDDPGRLADRAAAVLSAWLGLERRTLPPLDLRGVDAGHARAVGLVGAGLPFEALAALEAEAALARLTPRAERLLVTLRAALEGTPLPDAATVDDLAVVAVAALSLGDAEGALEAFEGALAEGLAVAAPWLGALAHNGGDAARARSAFDAAAGHPGYDFGVASRAAYAASTGDEASARRDLDALLERGAA